MERINRTTHLRLSTGRCFYQCCETLSVDMFDPKIIYYGHDGSVNYTETDPDSPDDDNKYPLTAVERIEIADAMIRAWETIKANAEHDAAEELKHWCG